MTRQGWWAIGGLAALAFGVWCFFNFEKVTEREFVGYSGEAARNPLLALQRLTERMGVPAGVVKRAVEIDSLPPGSTLVLSRSRYGMTPVRIDRILRWIENGGRLIVEAEPVGERDALLEALRVERREAPAGKGLTEVKLKGYDRPFRVALVPMTLSGGLAQGYSSSSGAATAVLQFDHGSGGVIVLPSFYFMKNYTLGDADHAAYAWALLRFSPGRPVALTRVMIAPRFERPSLLAWLAHDALPAVAGAGVLLVLWLVRKARRFGPIVPQHETGRRRLLDHLRASGRFEWSVHAAPKLLAAAREACLANIAKARPALAGIPPEERAARFAALTGLPAREVELAFAGDASTPRSFIAAVQTLQSIEEKLARRAGG